MTRQTLLITLGLSALLAAKLPAGEMQSPPDWVTTIAAPGATCSAVSAPGRLSFFGGHDDQGGYLLLQPLDAKGIPTGDAQRMREPFVGAARRPLDVRAHPSKPLLYVWRDRLPDSDAPQEPFAHLLVYRITNSALQEAGAFATGAAFASGKHTGMMTLDLPHDRLFIPNALIQDAKGEWTPAIACVDLDANGLPKTRDDGDLAMRSSPLGRLAAPLGWPFGVVGATRDVVMFGANRGFGVWEWAEPEARLNMLTLNWARQECMMIGHPDESLVYLVANGWRYLYVMRHVDGYMTMMPRIVPLQQWGAMSQPQVIASRNTLAVGAFNGVYLVPLDDGGQPTGESHRLHVAAERVVTLAYNETFDRLYIPVEQSP